MKRRTDAPSGDLHHDARHRTVCRPGGTETEGGHAQVFVQLLQPTPVAQTADCYTRRPSRMNTSSWPNSRLISTTVALWLRSVMACSFLRLKGFFNHRHAITAPIVNPFLQKIPYTTYLSLE